MREKDTTNICQCCGAPITSEICFYCGTPTGLDTAQANMDYPVIDCKEAVVNFWNLAFPAIFAVSFGILAIGAIAAMIVEPAGLIPAICCIPFLLISIVATSYVIRTLVRYVKVKSCGKKITATVYGYMDDTVLLNGVPAQIVKLLVQTPEGPRFIMYQLEDTKQPYGVNSQIHLLVYQNFFMVDKSAEKINWG